jgi:hypothetical protein
MDENTSTKFLDMIHKKLLLNLNIIKKLYPALKCFF